MRNLVRIVPFALLLLLAPGCVVVDVVPLGNTAYEPRPHSHPVPFFDAEEDVRRPFVKVARVHADADDLVSTEAILRALREQVRTVGGDALLLRGTEHYTVVDDCGEASRGRVFHGLAIRFTATAGGG